MQWFTATFKSLFGTKTKSDSRYERLGKWEKTLWLVSTFPVWLKNSESLHNQATENQVTPDSLPVHRHDCKATHCWISSLRHIQGLYWWQLKTRRSALFPVWRSWVKLSSNQRQTISKHAGCQRRADDLITRPDVLAAIGTPFEAQQNFCK